MQHISNIRMWLLAFICIWSLAGCGDAGAQDRQMADEVSALALLGEPGHHAIMRHAIAPGSGDPQTVVIGDCTTQRNLSGDGREQARRLGAQLKAAGVQPTQILSSQWCRCMQTGELLGLGPVTGFEPINSVWTQSDELLQRRTRDTLSMLETLKAEDKLILVTHSVNITALTGLGTASGAGWIFKVEDGRVNVVGAIAAP